LDQHGRASLDERAGAFGPGQQAIGQGNNLVGGGYGAKQAVRAGHHMKTRASLLGEVLQLDQRRIDARGNADHTLAPQRQHQRQLVPPQHHSAQREARTQRGPGRPGAFQHS
jgi:hypothetical protein